MIDIDIGPATFYYNSVLNSGNKKGGNYCVLPEYHKCMLPPLT